MLMLASSCSPRATARAESKVKPSSMVLQIEHIWDAIKRNRVQKGIQRWLQWCDGPVNKVLTSRIFGAFKTEVTLY